MAKTRAQRKAERRAREAEEQKRSGGVDGARTRESHAQHDTQTGVSGEVAEVEAVEMGIAAGAPEADLETPDAPKRSQRRAEAKAAKQAERKRREEQKRHESEQLQKKEKQAAARQQRQGGARGGVIGFLISCWAELKKVQWPDRETLVQATAVTVIFVAIAAAYLGALDAFFNFLVKQIL